MAQTDNPQLLSADGGGDVAGFDLPFAAADLTVTGDDLAAGGQDQAQGVIGDVFVIDARRMADRQAARTAPFDVDAVIARGETGDEAEVRKLFDQRLVQRRFAGDDQGADVVGGLDRRAFPETCLLYTSPSPRD